MVDYTQEMKIVFYKDTDEIEIKDDSEYFIYFEDIDEFIDLLETCPRLIEALKEKLKVI